MSPPATQKTNAPENAYSGKLSIDDTPDETDCALDYVLLEIAEPGRVT